MSLDSGEVYLLNQFMEITVIRFYFLLILFLSQSLGSPLVYADQSSGVDSTEIKELIQKIKEDIYLDRLTYPPRSNAVLKIKALEELKPDHPMIRPLYKKVAEAYVTLANHAIKEEKYISATSYIKKAEKYYPEGTFYEKYKKLIRDRQSDQNSDAFIAVNKKDKDSTETSSLETESVSESDDLGESEEESELIIEEDLLVDDSDVEQESDELTVASKLIIPEIKKQEPEIKRPKPIKIIDLDQSILEKPLAEVDETLNKACREIVDKNAFVQIVAESKKAYRSLLVKLTVCTRMIDDRFHLRHQHELVDENRLALTLYKERFNKRYTKPSQL